MQRERERAKGVMRVEVVSLGLWFLAIPAAILFFSAQNFWGKVGFSFPLGE